VEALTRIESRVDLVLTEDMGGQTMTGTLQCIRKDARAALAKVNPNA